MRGWTGIVESAALLAIVILALGVMVHTVKPSDALKSLGTILGIVALLIHAAGDHHCNMGCNVVSSAGRSDHGLGCNLSHV